MGDRHAGSVHSSHKTPAMFYINLLQDSFRKPDCPPDPSDHSCPLKQKCDEFDPDDSDQNTPHHNDDRLKKQAHRNVMKAVRHTHATYALESRTFR